MIPKMPHRQHSLAVIAQGAWLNAGVKLAEQLGLPLTDTQSQHFSHFLILNEHGLSLQQQQPTWRQAFQIDFAEPSFQYRLQRATLKNELIARALGVKPGENSRIIDTTAGLARDAAILAKLGYQLTLIERSPIIYALLQDALQRALPQNSWLSHIQLVHADAIEWLQAGQRADVIYLDPMFPSRQKSAAVKKEMIVLQALVGADQDSDKLFETALACAARRVVVKRPRLSNFITDQPPNYALTGNSSRFDIYVV